MLIPSSSKQQNHDLATRLGKAESDYTTLTSRFQDLETDLELARSHLKEEKAAREDDALRLQEMEESLQQQQEEMEETDDRCA